MKQIISILTTILPPILSPTGLYLANDPEIFRIHFTGEPITEYRIPNHDKGGRLRIKNNKGETLYIYINSNKEKFDKTMHPDATEQEIDDKKLISLSDEKNIGLIYGMFKKEWPKRKWSLQDTCKLMKVIDQALEQRNGHKDIISKEEWKKIKNEITESKIEGTFNLSQLKGSFIPKQTNIEGLSSDSEGDN